MSGGGECSCALLHVRTPRYLACRRIRLRTSAALMPGHCPAALRQGAEGAQQRAEALMRETAALLLAAEQIRRPMPRKELLGRSGYARLWARLETMPVIEQAKGILMGQSGCGPEAAFDLLRRASQRSNVPVRELAVQIVARMPEQSPAGSQPGRLAS